MTDLPRPVLKVALAKGPNDATSGGDFTDLSDRVLSVRCTRGRNSPRDDFQPGRLSVLLDNSDRALDPGNEDGLVYAPDGLGLPLCPVTLDLVWNGSTYRRFTGFLGPDCWAQDFTRGTASTVELQAIDALAYSPSLPPYLWGILVKQLGRVDPDKTYWHLPMDHGFPVLADGTSEIKNRSGSGGAAGFFSPGSGNPLGRIRPEFSNLGPAVVMPPESYLVSEAADVMPDGDEANLTFGVWWRYSFEGTTELTSGEVAVIASMRFPGGGNTRWKAQVEDDGDLHIYTYDSGGTLVDSDTISPTSGRWDFTSNGHLLIVRFTSGTTMKVWMDGISVTLTATSTVYESDLLLGPCDGPADVEMDEAFLIRRSLTDDEVAGINLAAAYNQIWFGFSHADTLGAFYEAAGRIVTVDDTNQWHVPAADPDEYGYYGLSSNNGGLPANLLEAARNVAGPFGAVWATRDGYLRVRTIDALTDATHAAHYATVSAQLTDEDATLSGTEYRHAGVSRLGPQLDRIVNAATCLFRFMTTPGDITTAIGLQIGNEDDASIARYGRQEQNFQTIAWHGWPRAAVAVDETIARYAEPAEEFDVIALDATGDTRLCAWLAGTCELELAVTVTYTPPGSDPITATDLNIQHEDWSLTPERFTASLRVAKS